tara:strand:- start:20818 stop:22500 length:1683 start_codon:yes stop_codon:yes gene_type:complete
MTGSSPTGKDVMDRHPIADSMIKRICSGRFIGLIMYFIACSTYLTAEIARAEQTGQDAQVIAHWNVVPFQAIDAPFNVGVVAFHINGIDRVEFQINGGEIRNITEMSHNPRTGTSEYWTTVDPTEIGAIDPREPLIEIRATAFPKKAGLKRELPRISLNVKAADGRQDAKVWVSGNGDDVRGDGSESKPFRQPARALRLLKEVEDRRNDAVFGTIYLKKGNYIWGSAGEPSPTADTRWVNISAAPGVKPDDVMFMSTKGGRFQPLLLKITGASFESISVTPSKNKVSQLWLENSNIYGAGPWEGEAFYHGSNWQGLYFTNVFISDFVNGATHLTLARNVTVSNIGSDAFSGTRLVVNSEVNGIDRGETQFHPDVYQIYCGRKSLENFIVYGLVARDAEAQGIFSGGCSSLDNVAVVNALLVRPLFSNQPLLSQWNVKSNHLILSGITMPNSTFLWRNNDVRNVLIEGSVFYRLSTTFKGYGFEEGAISSRHNHIIDTRGTGMRVNDTDITTGDAGFVDDDKGDFRPVPGSPLRNRIDNPFSAVDAMGQPRKVPSSIGALE